MTALLEAGIVEPVGSDRRRQCSARGLGALRSAPVAVAVIETPSLFTRLWFAWLCFFRILFDGPFAARVLAAREPQRLSAPDTTDASSPMPVRAPVLTPALQLLSLLQREGRFVDFIQQDIGSFPDADVGAAARVVHDGCRKTLLAHATIEPVRTEDEGARVVLPDGFDPDEVRLTGSVSGQPPYSGVLRHRGWRATRLELPQLIGEADANILFAAEVELS